MAKLIRPFSIAFIYSFYYYWLYSVQHWRSTATYALLLTLFVCSMSFTETIFWLLKSEISMYTYNNNLDCKNYYYVCDVCDRRAFAVGTIFTALNLIVDRKSGLYDRSWVAGWFIFVLLASTLYLLLTCRYQYDRNSCITVFSVQHYDTAAKYPCYNCWHLCIWRELLGKFLTVVDTACVLCM